MSPTPTAASISPPSLCIIGTKVTDAVTEQGVKDAKKFLPFFATVTR